MSPLPPCIVPGCLGAGEYRVEGGWRCYEHMTRTRRQTTRAGRLTLRDIDNRDGDVPYEFTGSRKQIIGYLLGPLRNDLTEGEGQKRGGEAIRLAIEAIQRGDLATANEHLQWLGVQVRLP